MDSFQDDLYNNLFETFSLDFQKEIYMLYKCCHFVDFLFITNFSYNFSFCLDGFQTFGHPRILTSFSFQRDSFERECKIVYTWENFQEILIGIVGVRYWIQVPPIHFRENISESLNRVCIYYSLSYCYFFIARIKSVFHRNSKNWKKDRNIYFWNTSEIF